MRPPLQVAILYTNISRGYNPQLEEEVKKMSAQKDINLEQIYKMISEVQRDVALIKKCLIEEPELRADFIEKMKDIDVEELIDTALNDVRIRARELSYSKEDIDGFNKASKFDGNPIKCSIVTDPDVLRGIKSPIFQRGSFYIAAL